MCGYLRRHIKPRTLREFLDLLGLKSYGEQWPEDDEAWDIPVLEHFYPAFGGDINKQIKGLLINEGGELKLVDATWWYDAKEIDGTLILKGEKSINARNLYKNSWREAINVRRGIAIVTGLGEGKKIDGKDKKFLVTADRLLLVGALYQKFPSGKYTCVIITRDEHPRFTPYHEKSFPLFLPYSREFLKLWLSDTEHNHPQIAGLLANPKIFTDLTIKPVKTFIGEAQTGPIEYVAAD